MSWVFSNATFFLLVLSIYPGVVSGRGQWRTQLSWFSVCCPLPSGPLPCLGWGCLWPRIAPPSSSLLPPPHSLPLHSCQWLIWKAHLTLVLASGLSSEILHLLGSHRWKLTEITSSLFQKPHPFHTSVLLVKSTQLFHACHHFWNFYLRCCTLKYLTVATDRSNLKVLASFSFFPLGCYFPTKAVEMLWGFLFPTLLLLCFPLHYPPVATPQLY